MINACLEFGDVMCVMYIVVTIVIGINQFRW